VFAAIRAVDRKQLIWYEPNVLFNFSADTNLPAFGDRSAGMSFHFYCTPGIAAPPYNVASCDQQNEHVLSNADKRAQATGDALILSEFGATDDLSSLSSNVDLADRHMVSWEYWHYCECADPTTSGSGVQAVVVDPGQSPSGSNVKTAKLAVLSEPYPRAIAGTPSGYGFDPATGVFRLSYSTRGPGGKNFARRGGKRSERALKRKQTEIYLGGIHYPEGYRAAVRGAAILSKPRAKVLRLIACPGRRQVSVAVGPPGSGVHRHASCDLRRRA
jgi:endoglycosylceramidase